ncbi:hypothetical protein K461DRAFT_274920 [Myriangium duriaei CBS 260.36]|uniref:MARVEL domain-containing protein n=1 Tax=Myriangium duriaei CBS 260.36 TaxID=1168546 RepID=A0A9P4MIE0_9PEZI|nr:hypothetical protein K461DRAFT_274920 [Myriangium duriaei CBS 260.36]
MLPIRAVQFVFTIIVLGLTGHVVDLAYYWSPSEVNFLLFTSIWTMLVLIYLIVTELKFSQYAHKFAVFGLEFVTMIFWFAGFIALAVLLSDSGCDRAHGNGVCSELQAAAVFGAFNWVLFAITTTMATIHVLRTRNSGGSAPAPEMQATADATA